MKVFWALIGLLVLGTVGLFASGVLSDKKAAPIERAPAIVAAPPVPEPQKSAPRVEVVAIERPAPVATPAEKADVPVMPTAAIPAAEVPAPTAPAAEAKHAPETVNAVGPAAEPSKLATEPTEESPLVQLRKEVEAQRAAEAAKREAEKFATPAVPQVTAPSAVPSAPLPVPAPVTQPAPSETPAADLPFAGAKVETKPDGSLLFDDKYIVKGKGTQEDPYKVTWDQLVSAQNEYAPKEGRKTIPPRIQALNDKWLDITGYVAFPLMTAEADELLSMMNQWDGCCIGVPPTPYDAVEVRLMNPVSGNARLTTYGSIKGKFKVDPHLVGGWLVGLYVMDQAKLTPVSYGGIAP